MNTARVEQVRGKHASQAEAIVSVEEAVVAAGSDPAARIKAGITAVLANVKQLKNPHDQREALAQFEADLDGFVQLLVTGVPEA